MAVAVAVAVVIVVVVVVVQAAERRVLKESDKERKTKLKSLFSLFDAAKRRWDAAGRRWDAASLRAEKREKEMSFSKIRSMF